MLAPMGVATTTQPGQGSTTMTTVNEDDVRDALSRVMDPEAGMNIVDLGLVYGIDVSPQGVQVRLTMTSAACPMAEMIVDEAHGQLAAALPADTPVEIELVWDPPWTPERMSEVARSMFGWQPAQ
jgi:metal-sulfur cluster biosynthetic enzyme